MLRPVPASASAMRNCTVTQNDASHKQKNRYNARRPPRTSVDSLPDVQSRN